MAVVRPTRTLVVALVVLIASAAFVSHRPAYADGVTYYVATDGSDSGSGTEDDPWGTLWYSMRQLQAGDTLLVRGGTYVERINVNKQLAPGRPDARVDVRNYPGERPVVKGGMDTGQFTMGDYWTFDGVNFTWDDKYGPNIHLVRLVDGVGWEIRNSEIWGNRSYSAVRIISQRQGQPSDWVLRGNCIHDTAPANSYNNDHNVYVTSNLDAGPGLIADNIIFNAPNGANVKLGAGDTDLPGTHNVRVTGNTMAGALHNVLVPWRSHDNRITWNLLLRGPVTSDKSWYPNIRGLQLGGHDNVAENNMGYGAPKVIENWKDSRTGVVDGGGNRLESPSFDDTTSCAGFDPSDPLARSYGAKRVIHRLAGASRVHTSVALSYEIYRDPALVNAVVVARADAYPDALAGAPLAAKVGGPVLLTNPGGLDAPTAAEVRRLGARTAYLLGGTSALSEQVERDLRTAGVTTIHRLAGDDRFETAAQLGGELSADTAYVVQGSSADPARGWPDALSVAPLAAATGRPILLTGQDDLPAATRTFIRDSGISKVVIVGGTAAVSETVASALEDIDGDGTSDTTVDRVAGTNRFATSGQVAELMAGNGANVGDVWFATGHNYPDALAAGPAVAVSGGVFLLVDSGSLDGSPAAKSWIEGHRGSIARVTLVGGVAAIGLGVQDGIALELAG